MAVFRKPGELIDWIPPEQMRRPESERIVYTLKVPTVYERVAWRRAVAAKGGRRYGPSTLLATLKSGVLDFMDEGPERDFIVTSIDEQIGRSMQVMEAAGSASVDADTFFEALSAAAHGENALAPVEALIEQVYEPYAAMRARNAVYSEIAAIEGARLFLTEIRNGPPLERDKAGALTDQVLGQIPEAHMLQIGIRIEELVSPTEQEAKNSDSPSPGPSDETASTAASTQPSTIP